MHEVVVSTFSWCVGSWTVTRRQLASLSAVFARSAKKALRAPRLWSDMDEAYHRRGNRLLKKTLVDCGLASIDVHVLGRMFDYTGHLLRAVETNPGHLTGQIVALRDAQWKRMMTEEVGHQGHPGRINPWNWEYQYHVIFVRQGLEWKDVPQDRDEWRSHRQDWIRHMLGRRAHTAIHGAA